MNKGQDLLILKETFKRIYESIFNAYSDYEFECYILDNDDEYSFCEYKEDLEEIKASFDKVVSCIDDRIDYESRYKDSQNSFDNNKDKELEVLGGIFDTLKDVMDINNKYYHIMEILEMEYEDINEDNSLEDELETKNALKDFMIFEGKFNEIYMDYKKELEGTRKSPNIIKRFLERIEVTLNLGILSFKNR